MASYDTSPDPESHDTLYGYPIRILDADGDIHGTVVKFGDLSRRNLGCNEPGVVDSLMAGPPDLLRAWLLNEYGLTVERFTERPLEFQEEALRKFGERMTVTRAEEPARPIWLDWRAWVEALMVVAVIWLIVSVIILSRS